MAQDVHKKDPDHQATIIARSWLITKRILVATSVELTRLKKGLPPIVRSDSPEGNMDPDERRRETRRKTERVVRIEERALEPDKKTVRWACSVSLEHIVCAAVFLTFLAGEGNATNITFKEVPVAIKPTSYPVPAGAFFVSPTGNDSNPGTLAAPWRTLQKANDTAPAGSTIVIRGGVYRGVSVVVGNTLTFQAYPGEEVWLKGSEVLTSWMKDDTVWRSDGWVPRSSMAPGGNSGFIDPAYWAADYPDQVFLDGVPLGQVLQKSQVGPGKFYVDHTVQKLWIGDDPTGKLVEASSVATAMFVA